MVAFMYILHSQVLGRFYVGHTTEEVRERLRKHLAAHAGYTARAKDWQILLIEAYPSKIIAYKREREIKGWKNKERILSLIRAGSEHPA